MKPGGLKNLSITGGQCLIDVPRFSAVQYMLLAALRFETDSFCFSLKSLTFYISRVFFTEVCKYLQRVSVWSFASFCAVTAKQLFQGLVFGFFLPGIFKGLQSLQMSV